MDSLRVLHCYSTTTTSKSPENQRTSEFRFLRHHHKRSLSFLKPKITLRRQYLGFGDRPTGISLQQHSSRIICCVSSVQTREEEKKGETNMKSKTGQENVRLSV